MTALRLLALAWALLCTTLSQAPDGLPVPPLAARVFDQTGTLNEAQRAALESKLAAFEAKSGPQIVVLVVAATAPEDITAYAQRVAEAWSHITDFSRSEHPAGFAEAMAPFTQMTLNATPHTQ